MASFEKAKNGTWSVRFRFVEFGTVKNKRLSGFETKKDAMKAYTEFSVTHQSSKKSDNNKMTFEELWFNYLNYINNRLKVSSIYDIKHNVCNHILPSFGKLQIFKISKTDILNWQNILNETKYSYKFKSKLRGYLSAMFKYAVLYFDLPQNPVSQVEPFKRLTAKKEVEVWSKEQFNTFIKEVDNTIYQTYFTFLYLTGCRKGEAFALTWKDIDFKKQTVTFNKNLTRKVDGKPYEIVTTKTGKNRTILLPAVLLQQLEALYNESTKNKDHFVFGGPTPLAENTTTRIFNKAIEKSKVPKLHLHCLRHSHASLLISSGESIVMVSKRLGHSSIEQTLDTYSHLMPNEEAKMMEKLNKNIFV